MFSEHIDASLLPFSQTDDYRAPHASNNGGFELTDEQLLEKHRSVISAMIAVSIRFVKSILIGKKSCQLTHAFPGCVIVAVFVCLSLCVQNVLWF